MVWQLGPEVGVDHHLDGDAAVDEQGGAHAGRDGQLVLGLPAGVHVRRVDVPERPGPRVADVDRDRRRCRPATATKKVSSSNRARGWGAQHVGPARRLRPSGCGRRGAPPPGPARSRPARAAPTPRRCRAPAGPRARRRSARRSGRGRRGGPPGSRAQSPNPVWAAPAASPTTAQRLNPWLRPANGPGTPGPASAGPGDQVPCGHAVGCRGPLALELGQQVVAGRLDQPAGRLGVGHAACRRACGPGRR